MRTALHKPYLISWLFIPILVLIGLLFGGPTLDVQLHDTYYVIANKHIVLAGSTMLFVIGVGYWLVGLIGKTPNVALTIIHLFLTTGVLISGVLPPFSSDRSASAEWFFLSLIALLLGQCTYAVNLLITLLRRGSG